jgi:hypothetical protein
VPKKDNKVVDLKVKRKKERKKERKKDISEEEVFKTKPQ